jgi:hypothetical protein
MQVSPERPEFAEELPKFVAKIQRIFTPHQVVEIFDDVQAGLVPDPAKLFNLDFEEVELDENRAGLLKPLGHPARNGAKYFATVTLAELWNDAQWLVRPRLYEIRHKRQSHQLFRQPG